MIKHVFSILQPAAAADEAEEKEGKAGEGDKTAE